jgi:hypothetical protein
MKSIWMFSRKKFEQGSQLPSRHPARSYRTARFAMLLALSDYHRRFHLVAF